MTLHSEVEKAQVELAKEHAAFGMRTVNRNKDIGSLLSDHEKDEIRTDAQIASLELQEITTRLALKTLHSPLTGHVVETFRDEGEFVADDPVVTIVSIDPLYAEIVAPAEFMGKVTKGDKARITLEFGRVGEVAARVISVDPIIDAASGTFRIRLELANKGGKIPSGLPCSVNFSS